MVIVKEKSSSYHDDRPLQAVEAQVEGLAEEIAAGDVDGHIRYWQGADQSRRKQRLSSLSYRRPAYSPCNADAIADENSLLSDLKQQEILPGKN